MKEYDEQILIAKMAQDALAELKRGAPGIYAKFAKWFHLRPGSKNITIVTTHPCRPMRGIYVGKTIVKSAVEFLADCIGDDGETINWDKIKGISKGFVNKEFPFQADMINNLHRNLNLKKLIGARNLYFIASEVIFSRSDETRKKVDIVAHDGEGKIFFFEMKSPENKKDDPVEQVKKYIDIYGKGGRKNAIFETMMKNYPQNPITEINEYIGYGIIGYNDNPVLIEEMLIKCR